MENQDVSVPTPPAPKKCPPIPWLWLILCGLVLSIAGDLVYFIIYSIVKKCFSWENLGRTLTCGVGFWICWTIILSRMH